MLRLQQLSPVNSVFYASVVVCNACWCLNLFQCPVTLQVSNIKRRRIAYLLDTKGPEVRT